MINRYLLLLIFAPDHRVDQVRSLIFLFLLILQDAWLNHAIPQRIGFLFRRQRSEPIPRQRIYAARRGQPGHPADSVRDSELQGPWITKRYRGAFQPSARTNSGNRANG